MLMVLAKLTELTQDPSSRDHVTLVLGTCWEHVFGIWFLLAVVKIARNERRACPCVSRKLQVAVGAQQVGLEVVK